VEELPARFSDPSTTPFYDNASGAWNVFRYNAVGRVARDYGVFSSHRPGPPNAPLAESIGAVDPPEHRWRRNIVVPALSQPAVDALQDAVAAITDDLLAAFESSHHTDVIEHLAAPLPLQVTCRIMGLPLTETQRLKQWTDELASMPTSRVAPELGDARAFLREVLEQARAQPPNDTVVALVAHGSIHGRALTTEQQVADLLLLLVGGAETTTHLIGNALLCFDDFDSLDEVRADPGVLPTALEEVLRWKPPFPVIMRTATRDIKLDGTKIEAGQTVNGWIPAANRDAAKFDCPLSFDIRREPNKHLSFGMGAHFCIGAPLARLEGRVAVGRMLARLSDLRIDRSKPMVSRLSIVNALRELHISYRVGEAAA
jgi:cytochrome P450